MGGSVLPVPLHTASFSLIEILSLTHLEERGAWSQKRLDVIPCKEWRSRVGNRKIKGQGRQIVPRWLCSIDVALPGQSW